MRLPWTVVRILAEHHDAGRFVRRQVQRGEDLVRRREDRVTGTLVGDELLQLVPVRLVELAA